MRDLSRRLIAHETGENNTRIPAAFQVGEKLRPQLTTLMGGIGFRALISRALVLANAEVPWLRLVQVKADGSLQELYDEDTQVDPKEVFQGSVVLLAHLLGLLVAFIGENLTLGLVREVWPKLPPNDLDFSKGEK